MVYQLFFGESNSNKHYWAKPDHTPSFSFIHVLAGLEHIPNDVELTYSSMKGDLLNDFMGGSDGVNLISKRMIGIFQLEGLTGFELKEVVLINNGVENKDYYALLTDNTCDFIDKAGYGKVDESTMLADFSTPKGTGGVVCSERAKDIIKKNADSLSSIRMVEYEKKKSYF